MESGTTDPGGNFRVHLFAVVSNKGCQEGGRSKIALTLNGKIYVSRMTTLF